MKQFAIILFCTTLTLLIGCDHSVKQTFIVKINVPNADQNSILLVESNTCSGKHIKADWYRDGLWIFRLSSIRGGLSVVTQELTLCKNNSGKLPDKIWHSLHGGGAPLIVLSCINNKDISCRMYQDGYAPQTWSD